MNTKTGEVVALKPGQSVTDLAKQYGGKASDWVPVERLPDGTCKLCNGRGSVKRGLNSKRFKPCRCVS